PRVFISYGRADYESAKRVRKALVAAGHNVWWDDELLAAGKWSDQIEKALVNADAVVVLWSKNAEDSDWVRHESSISKVRGTLTNAQIGEANIPQLYRESQIVDLTGWNGSAEDPQFQKLTSSIQRHHKRGANRKLAWAGAALLVAFIGCVAGWFLSAALNTGETPLPVDQRAFVSEAAPFSPLPGVTVSGNVVTIDNTFPDEAAVEQLQTIMESPAGAGHKRALERIQRGFGLSGLFEARSYPMEEASFKRFLELSQNDVLRPHIRSSERLRVYTQEAYWSLGGNGVRIVGFPDQPQFGLGIMTLDGVEGTIRIHSSETPASDRYGAIRPVLNAITNSLPNVSDGVIEVPATEGQTVICVFVNETVVFTAGDHTVTMKIVETPNPGSAWRIGGDALLVEYTVTRN
ncbi:MAG: toll/interleukin-1 receptor domain-containing protein, partial [Pirellulaceae bacterium]